MRCSGGGESGGASCRPRAPPPPRAPIHSLPNSPLLPTLPPTQHTLPTPRRKRGFEEWGEDGDRPFVLSRAFFSGTQRVGAIWTGDNAGAPSSPPPCKHASLLGLPARLPSPSALHASPLLPLPLSNSPSPPHPPPCSRVVPPQGFCAHAAVHRTGGTPLLGRRHRRLLRQPRARAGGQVVSAVLALAATLPLPYLCSHLLACSLAVYLACALSFCALSTPPSALHTVRRPPPPPPPPPHTLSPLQVPAGCLLPLHAGTRPPGDQAP